MDLSEVLKVYGYDGIREVQKKPIDTLLSNRDCIVIIPTGGGKSFIYGSVALIKGYKTIVFFPIIALMNDQADKFRALGINVSVISSMLSQEEKSRSISDWVSGKSSFLFVAPERLEDDGFWSMIINYPPDFVVVDEIHVASEASESFRPSFSKIKTLIEKVNPKLFLGLTATMNNSILEDTIKLFDCEGIEIIKQFYDRDNLHYSTLEVDGGDYDSNVLNLCRDNGVPSIVYCSTVSACNRLYTKALTMNMGDEFGIFHGRLAAKDKYKNQEDFILGKKRVVVATNAFGMGVDKSDIGCVIFRDIPSSVSDLAQGFGRGGRNGCDCDCIIVDDFGTLSTQYRFIDTTYPRSIILQSYSERLKEYLNGFGGEVITSEFEICKALNFNKDMFKAVLNILRRNGNITVLKNAKEDFISVRFLSNPSNDYFAYWFNLINYCGAENLESDSDKSCIKASVKSLEEYSLRNISYILKVLKSFKEDGFCDYKYGKSGIKILFNKDLEDSVIDNISRKREDSISNIEKVVDFVRADNKYKIEILKREFS